MKKYRKQGVKIHGKKRLVDVPVDAELYKADNREDYLRRVSRKKHVSLDALNLSGFSPDIAEAYEETQLLLCLRTALLKLTEEERLLIKYIYFDGFNQRKTAAKLIITQQAVTKRHKKIIKKLRRVLIDWIE